MSPSTSTAAQNKADAHDIEESQLTTPTLEGVLQELPL